jgi:anti-anti-sigma regulatory factor
MTLPSAKLMVFASGQLAWIKIAGRANFTSSIDFKMLVNELLQKGFSHFILDLSECVLMDSTFLGVLAGFGLKMTGAQNGENKSCIELLNPNARITELLENLGVAHLFKTVTPPVDQPKELDARVPEIASPSREEITGTCLEAHRILMQIAPGNVPKFKEVTQFLAEDLKKLKAGS